MPRVHARNQQKIRVHGDSFLSGLDKIADCLAAYRPLIDRISLYPKKLKKTMDVPPDKTMHAPPNKTMHAPPE